jgi:hypothetical protein
MVTYVDDKNVTATAAENNVSYRMLLLLLLVVYQVAISPLPPQLLHQMKKVLQPFFRPLLLPRRLQRVV